MQDKPPTVLRTGPKELVSSNRQAGAGLEMLVRIFAASNEQLGFQPSQVVNLHMGQGPDALLDKLLALHGSTRVVAGTVGDKAVFAKTAAHNVLKREVCHSLFCTHSSDQSGLVQCWMPSHS